MNKLIRLNPSQLDILGDKLTRAGVSPNSFASHSENRVFYQFLGDMGFDDSRQKIGRAIPPNYKELGFTRVAGPPTEEDIANYAKVTNGGVLTKDGLVVQALMFDSDLITDRYSIATMNLLVDLYQKYLGRSNDFNHRFDVTQARTRVIDTHMGSDLGTMMHSDSPIESLVKMSPANPYSGKYVAFYSTLAFPYLENDPEQVRQKVENATIKDLSIAFFNAPKSTYCSICLSLMSSFWFWDYCEEHGFPGGETDSGQKVVAIMDHASDALTYGLVSDGAVSRASIVLDPFINDSNESEN